MSAIVNALDGQIARLASLADNAAIPYKTIVVWLTAAQTWFELWLMRRQVPMYSITYPPPELKEHLKKDTFDKAQSYGRDKLYFAFAKTLFNAGLAFGLIQAGTYSWAWDATGRLMDTLGLDQSRVITHSLLWTTALTLISFIPGMAWSYYSTFVLEEAHGFNKSTVGLWLADTAKTVLLAAVIGLPVLAGFLRIIELAGKNFVPWLMLFMVGVQLTLQIIFPIFIAPLFNKFTPLPAGEVRERVEKLAAKLGFPLKHLYVIDGSKRSSHSNAYFYGLPWSKQIVLYDTLLDSSTPIEVEAVLAHELGHWYYSHPARLMLVAQSHLFFTLVIFSIFIHNKALFLAFGFDPRLAVESPVGGPQPIVIGFILYQLLFEPLDTFVKFFMNHTTRKYEYQADEFAVKLGLKEPLCSALIKLHIDNLSSPHNDSIYSMYHHSHPTLPERIQAMDDYQGGDWMSPKAAKKQLPKATTNGSEGKKDL